MTGKWTATSFSSNSTPVAIDETLMKDEVVILLQGQNNLQSDIFCYLKLTLTHLIELKRAMLEGRAFMPSDYGTVLAAGQGEPSQELRSEMAVTHRMVDRPAPKSTQQPTKQKPKLGTFTARFAPEED